MTLRRQEPVNSRANLNDCCTHVWFSPFLTSRVLSTAIAAITITTSGTVRFTMFALTSWEGCEMVDSLLLCRTTRLGRTSLGLYDIPFHLVATKRFFRRWSTMLA
jgi:hypothetical protein